MEIIFNNLHTGMSVAGNGSFNGGRLIFDLTSHSIDQSSGDSFQNINGIALDVASIPNDPNQLQSLLFTEYVQALALLSAISGRFQTYAYFSQPLKCELNGTRYILHEHLFEEENFLERLHIIGGGSHCRDITFLGRKRSPSYFLDFYKEAKDETKPLDYRTLQLWRFFERWFNDRDVTTQLLKISHYEVLGGYLQDGSRKIDKYRINKRLVNSFNRYFRCAVAHGGAATGNHSRKVIIPRHANTDSNMFIILIIMLDVADYLLRKAPKSRF